MFALKILLPSIHSNKLQFCNSLKYLTGLETLSLWSLSLDYLDCLEYLPKSIHTLKLMCVFDIIIEVLNYLSEQTNITCLDLEDEIKDSYFGLDEEDDFFISLDRYIVTNKNLECITGYVDKEEMSRKREELLEKKVLPYITR